MKHFRKPTTTLKRPIIASVFIFTVLLIVLSACGEANNETEPIDHTDHTFVISSGSGYYLVGIFSSRTDGNSDKVGVKDNNGNWLHPLSADHYFVDDNGEILRTQNAIISFVPGFTEEQQIATREGIRRNDIRNSYRHYGGATFELVNETRGGGGNRREIVLVRYDARGNVLVD